MSKINGLFDDDSKDNGSPSKKEIISPRSNNQPRTSDLKLKKVSSSGKPGKPAQTD